jgi:hypothetical protein
MVDEHGARHSAVERFAHFILHTSYYGSVVQPFGGGGPVMCVFVCNLTDITLLGYRAPERRCRSGGNYFGAGLRNDALDRDIRSG